MKKNTISICGRTYNYTVFHTSKGNTIINFGLQFYSGKDQSGVSKYAFIDCKGFGKDYNLKDKQEVVVIGHLSADDWKDQQGNKKSKLFIVVDNVETKEQKQEQPFFEDTVPF